MVLINVEFLILKGEEECRCKGIDQGEGVIINEIEIEGQRCLVIIERGDIFQQEMKERAQKECINSVRATLKSKLNGGQAIKEINTWAMATVRNGTGVINWTWKEWTEKSESY